MFGFGRKKKQDMNNVNLGSVDLSKSNDMQMFTPRYEYTVKVFDMGDDNKPITEIQRGIKANSDEELAGIFALADQKIQILEKREINPPATQMQPTSFSRPNMPYQPAQQIVAQQPSPQPVPVKYFSAGGLEFKMIGQEVFQKQWIRATEEETSNIRIVSDTTNKIVIPKNAHFEIQHWIKVEENSSIGQA